MKRLNRCDLPECIHGMLGAESSHEGHSYCECIAGQLCILGEAGDIEAIGLIIELLKLYENRNNKSTNQKT